MDDRPYGGGPGMVMAAEPVLKAVAKARGRKKDVKVVILSPRGKQFTNAIAQQYARRYRDIIFIAGRYEGIDARVKKILRAQEFSIGPYTLSGGELPALVAAEAIARHIPGVLGKRESIEEARIASGEMYTRPEVLRHKGKDYRVPAVLTSGNHQKIEAWRKRRQKRRK